MQIYSMMDNLPDNDGYIGWCGGFELDSEATLTLDVEATDDTEYMFSAWLKCNQYGIVSPNVLDVSKGDYVNSNAWKRVSFATKVSNKEINIIFSQGKWEIYKAQLERGNKLTDWKENSEEASVENVYKQGTTQIDGDKIYTGSITADKIDVNGVVTVINDGKTTTIDGGRITANTIKADKIDVTDLFAQNITATGTITGATLKGTNAEITKGTIGNMYLADNNLMAGDSTGYADLVDELGNYKANIVTVFGEVGTLIGDVDYYRVSTMNSRGFTSGKYGYDENNEGKTYVSATYEMDSIKYRNNNTSYYLSFPKKAGTLALVGDFENVATVKNSNNTSIAIANNTNKALSSIVLTQGKYLIIGSISYASNSTGRRMAGMSTSSTSFSGGVGRNAIANAVNGDRTNIQVQTVVNVTSASETWYLLGYQNSGGELSGNMANIEAIRLQ